MRLIAALAAFACAAATTCVATDRARFWLTIAGGVCLLAFAVTRRTSREA